MLIEKRCLYVLLAMHDCNKKVSLINGRKVLLLSVKKKSHSSRSATYARDKYDFDDGLQLLVA